MKTVFLLLAVLLFFARPVIAGEEIENSLLIEAVKKETTDPHAVEIMVANRENVNVTDERGRTPLMLAAMYHPSPLVLHFLILGGADINARTPDTGKTALFFAVRYNSNPEIITALLNYGADPHIKDVFGRTAFDYADRNPKLKGSPVLERFHQRHDNTASSQSATSR